MMRSSMLAGITALAALGLVAGPALAQRDPAYAAARGAGKVGEQPDGYLGIVGAADPALQRLVDDDQYRAAARSVPKMAKENNATRSLCADRGLRQSPAPRRGEISCARWQLADADGRCSHPGSALSLMFCVPALRGRTVGACGTAL